MLLVDWGTSLSRTATDTPCVYTSKGLQDSNTMLTFLVILIVAVSATLADPKTVASPSAGTPIHHKEVRYEYRYAVDDPISGVISARWEHRLGEYVKGAYSLLDPDGKVRTVDYEVDGPKGFHAVVRTSPPANALLSSEQLAKSRQMHKQPPVNVLTNRPTENNERNGKVLPINYHSVKPDYYLAFAKGEPSNYKENQPALEAPAVGPAPASGTSSASSPSFSTGHGTHSTHGISTIHDTNAGHDLYSTHAHIPSLHGTDTGHGIYSTLSNIPSFHDNHAGRGIHSTHAHIPSLHDTDTGRGSHSTRAHIPSLHDISGGRGIHSTHEHISSLHGSNNGKGITSAHGTSILHGSNTRHGIQAKHGPITGTSFSNVHAFYRDGTEESSIPTLPSSHILPPAQLGQSYPLHTQVIFTPYASDLFGG